MKTTSFYNTAHPLAESGKPIFLPFGEWAYDSTRRQRLDRAHGEAIANELNARVAAGKPGIPVYQGHPDVPELAAKYPDKGAIGWITRIDLANEGGRDGLALAVEWDRDPGAGFKWFSPFWNAREHQGDTYIVSEIVSVGLVNNPNIEEFRLPNESAGNTNKERNPEMDKAKLCAALGLPEDAADEAVIAAIEKLKADAKDSATKLEAANAETEAEKKKTGEAEAALANERKAHRDLLLDQAVAEGRISVAGRAAWEKRLDDDFKAGAVALANEKPLKSESAVKDATPRKAAEVNLVALANERMSKNPGMSYVTAFAQVQKEHPEIK